MLLHRGASPAVSSCHAPGCTHSRQPRRRPLSSLRSGWSGETGCLSSRHAAPRRCLQQHALAMQQPLMIPRTQDMAGDPFGLLLRQRIVFLGGEVNDFVADAVVSQLLMLDASDPTKDIKFFINSPGGSVTAGMGIYDAMQICHANVHTFCFGLAASMGAFLLGAGTKGHRASMPNSRIMIHQPLGGASGQAVDIEIQAREIMYHKANINRIMAEYTGQPISKLEEDTDRDNYMSPLEAKQYGLIDYVIGGDEAGFNVKGSTTEFPKQNEKYLDWEDGQDNRGGRFKDKPLEPFARPLADNPSKQQ